MFSPALSRNMYKSAVTENLVQTAFAVSPDLAISAFADIFSRIPRKDLDGLERLIVLKSGRR